MKDFIDSWRKNSFKIFMVVCLRAIDGSVIIALDLKGEGVGSSEPSDCAICSILTEPFSIQEL